MLTPIPARRIRSGITLMEVLISIGILSIGLASVIAIIPAGAREAQRALVIDRGSTLAANALADAITRGLLDQATWSSVSSTSVAFDPLGTANDFLNTSLQRIAANGASDVDSTFRGGDDISYDVPEDGDAPAVPVYVEGERATRGAYSWLATLVPALPTSDMFRLTVVVFHLRSTPSQFSYEINSSMENEISLASLSLSEAEFRETFARGSCVLLSAPSHAAVWRQILLPLPKSQAGNVTEADLVLDRAVPFTPTHLNVFPGSIGFSEKMVSLEGASPWSL